MIDDSKEACFSRDAHFVRLVRGGQKRFGAHGLPSKGSAVLVTIIVRHRPRTMILSDGQLLPSFGVCFPSLALSSDHIVEVHSRGSDYERFIETCAVICLL
jgi:hypothetical protein